MVFKEMKKNKKVKEAALKEIRELKIQGRIHGIRCVHACTASNFGRKPHFLQDLNSCVTDGWTDRQMDGRTDGRTDPLIEMRGRI